MAKSYQDIQNELGIDENNTTEELLAKLNEYNVVSANEITKIISISVDRLENQVTGKAKEVKRRMYEPVTNDTKGIVSVLNKRIVLLDMIVKKLKKVELLGLDVKIDGFKESLDSQIESLTNDLSTVEQNLQNADNEINSSIDNLKSLVDSLDSAVSELTGVDTSFSEEITEIKATNDKALYNLGAYDTVVDNSDGTVTISRNNGAYEETVAKGVPLITLDQQGSSWLKEEWQKGLNLCNFANASYSDTDRTIYASGSEITLNGSASEPHLWIAFDKPLPSGTYTISTSFEGSADLSKGELYYYKEQGEYSARIPLDFETDLTITKTITSNWDITGLFFLYTGTINGTLKVMINEGSVAYPYEPYNANKHITNFEAEFLKEESQKSANLLPISDFSGEYSNTNFVIQDLILPIGTYTIKVYGTINTAGVYQLWFDKGGNIDGGITWSMSSELTFNITEQKTTIRVYTNGSVTNPQVMLNKGTKAQPYHEFEGEIVRTKELEEIKEKLDFTMGSVYDSYERIVRGTGLQSGIQYTYSGTLQTYKGLSITPTISGGSLTYNSSNGIINYTLTGGTSDLEGTITVKYNMLELWENRGVSIATVEEE